MAKGLSPINELNAVLTVFGRSTDSTQIASVSESPLSAGAQAAIAIVVLLIIGALLAVLIVYGYRKYKDMQLAKALASTSFNKRTVWHWH